MQRSTPAKYRARVMEWHDKWSLSIYAQPPAKYVSRFATSWNLAKNFADTLFLEFIILVTDSPVAFYKIFHTF